MHRLANPTRFLRIANALLPWLAAAAVLLLATGLWLALFRSPADYQQGETVRIMYVHVPAAWLALAGYSALALASAARKRVVSGKSVSVRVDLGGRRIHQ